MLNIGERPLRKVSTLIRRICRNFTTTIQWPLKICSALFGSEFDLSNYHERRK